MWYKLKDLLYLNAVLVPIDNRSLHFSLMFKRQGTSCSPGGCTGSYWTRTIFLPTTSARRRSRAGSPSRGSYWAATCGGTCTPRRTSARQPRSTCRDTWRTSTCACWRTSTSCGACSTCRGASTAATCHATRRRSPSRTSAETTGMQRRLRPGSALSEDFAPGVRRGPSRLG